MFRFVFKLKLQANWGLLLMSFLIVAENRTVLTGIVFNDNFAEKIGMFNSQHLNITVWITYFLTVVFIYYMLSL